MRGSPLNARSLISALFGIAAVCLLLALTPRSHIVPAGILLPAKNVRAPINPDSVTIYHQTPPEHFTVLGAVQIEQRFVTLDAATKNKLLQYAQDRAASVGANGLVINVFEPNQTEVGNVLSFMGTAIYIPHSIRSAKP